jgi:hypothetical protein
MEREHLKAWCSDRLHPDANSSVDDTLTIRFDLQAEIPQTGVTHMPTWPRAWLLPIVTDAAGIT